MHLPAHPSTLRKILLAPLSLGYALLSALHRRLWLRPVFPSPALPLIVTGSLRAGGSGKTAVTLELARYLATRGKRVGVLAYRIHGAGDIEIDSSSKWSESSDEAVLLRRGSGARVFATRNRARLWHRLAASGEFDVLLADDGILDARLAGSPIFRILVVRHGEHPGVLDQLPAGPYHLTAAALKKADFVLEFSREIVLPDNFDFTKSWWILSGMGNPAAFQKDLEAAGVQVAGRTEGPNHGIPGLRKAGPGSLKGGASGFLFTAKDGVKLAPRMGPGEVGLEIGERVPLSAAFLSAVDVFLAPPSS
jgi:tetraacyldisaccharide-1-P 4'-kinase